MESISVIIVAFFSGIAIGYSLHAILNSPKKEVKLSSPKEIKLSPEETQKIESHICIKCDSKLEGGINENGSFIILKCKGCCSVYHQYSGYGSFYLQP